jgi:pimeloyl-ACP methyl ester carboxylesterase
VRAVRFLPILAACLVVACSSTEPPRVEGGPRIGVIVLHGEASDPYGDTLRFSRAMVRGGFLVDSPEMPWSARRAYDAGVDGAMAEIDAAMARLKSRGAQKVFLAGHGLGASAAVRYAGRRRLDGLIALAPGTYPKLAAEGVQKTSTRDFLDPDGPMSLAKNVSAVRPGTPVLWVVGFTEYPALRKFEQSAFDSLPKKPPPKFAEVAAGHLDAPDAATAVCEEWMRTIAAQ